MEFLINITTPDQKNIFPSIRKILIHECASDGQKNSSINYQWSPGFWAPKLPLKPKKTINEMGTRNP